MITDNNNSPSFFERLTGAAKVPDETPIPTRVEVAGEEQSSRPTPLPIQETPPKKPPLTSKEEEEGQLTIDVYQTDTEIVIKSPVAGVSPQNLDVTITNDMVTIKGRRDSDEKIPKENYFFQELYWGPFSRSVILPTEIEMEQAKAILKDGILTIRLPKVEKETAKKLSIQLG